MTTPLVDVAKAAGITYRQADHWVHRDYIRTTYVARKTGKKVVTRLGDMNGRVAMLSPKEESILLLMAALVRAGISPEAAAKVARRMVRQRTRTAALAPGVQLTIEDVA
jgi:hypothetical protein